MPTYSRRTRIAAPLDRVWAFHSTIDGLRALTPPWMNLRIGGVFGPDGDPNPEELYLGSEIHMAMRPFGIGPQQAWVSRIVDRDRDEAQGYFVDEMLGGPFSWWEHTHQFFGDGEETVLVDTVVYELPYGSIGELAAPFGRLGLEGMFRDRHRRTKAVLE